MEKHSTLTQAKREFKEDGINGVLKIEVSEEMSNGEQVIDFNLNAYGSYTGNVIDSLLLETYSKDEMKKVLKRIEKLSENYEIVNNLEIEEVEQDYMLNLNSEESELLKEFLSHELENGGNKYTSVLLKLENSLKS